MPTFQDAVNKFAAEHPHDTSEQDAYMAYTNGTMTADDVITGYREGTIKVPTRVAPTDPPSWGSDDWMSTVINPWTYTPDKPEAEVLAIQTARDAAVPADTPNPSA